ncbi:MAG: Uncharacterized protein JWL86_2811 [Rhizobium sp.]|nr:Uncharacterized protein [Rhizobium sp.]
MIEPLTPPDLDLRDFDWMPLQVVRLRDSGIVVVASAEAFRAAVLLWCASWHQVPAASLPNDEKMLCSLAGFGRDVKAWRAISDDALHGYVECSDGRLYHPVIAGFAIESGSKKRKQSRQTAAATEAARMARLARNGVRNGVRDDNRNGNQGRGEDRRGEEKTETDRKKGESDSRSKVLKVVGEGEGEPVIIDETYQPSDRAIEYAYSLGMKKADLDAEHRKFVAMSVASRAKSFNPDMSFKLFCDRWLEFKRKNNPDWQPAPEIVRAPPEPFVLVIQDTVEAAAWNQSNREKGLRPLFFCKQVVDGVEIIAARCPSLVPPGYDEATGEKLAPNSEEHAA